MPGRLLLTRCRIAHLYHNSRSIIVNLNITLKTVNIYIEDYTDLCQDLIGKQLPFESSLGNTQLCTNETICLIDINKSIFLGYDLDFYIPISKIYSTKLNCENSEDWRWIVKIEKLNGVFYISGLKFHVILFPLIFFIFIYIVRDIKKTNSLINHWWLKNGGNKN